MALLLLLPLLVSGYLVCLKDPVIYYKLHRYDGQLLYLQVGRYGIWCFLWALVIVGTISALVSHSWDGYCSDICGQLCIPPFSTDFLAYLGKKAELAHLFTADNAQLGVFAILTGIATLFMPSCWAAVSFWLMKRQCQATEDSQAMAYILRETVAHSPLMLTLVEAFATKSEVMISMDDRKVYVGYIQSVGKPTEVVGVDQEVEFLPSVSGYRDKDTLKVNYTTEYPTDTKIEPIYFKQANMVSVSLFSRDIRAAFEKAAESDDSKAEKFAQHLDTFLEKLVKAIKAN
ncbi:hypothetical protein ACFPU0_04655 [Pseudomonas sp. GCM10022186]|uniref:hypothetical protein n=1 Tax=Pseudomonas sp. GCM10022186 TaxID=3252650 RepID=UPI0036159169